MPTPRAVRAQGRRPQHDEATVVHEESVEPEDLQEGLHRPVAGLVHHEILRESEAGPSGDPLGGTAVSADVAQTLRRRQGSGSPLPADIAGPAGAALDTDLGGVRLHADAEAGELSRSMQAAAFTLGSDVYLTGGPGSIGSSSGQRLLAHELVHVAQNARGGGGSAAAVPTIGPAHDPAEVEADHLADHVLDGLRRQNGRQETGVGAPSAVGTVQRSNLDALRRQTVRAGGAPVIRRGLLSNIWSEIKSFFGVPKKGKKGKKGPDTKDSEVIPVPEVKKGPGTSGPQTTGPEVKGPETKAPEIVPVPEVKKEPEIVQAPVEEVVEYPKVVTIGSEKVNLEQEADLEEAKSIIAELKSTYGIDLSSPTAMDGVKGNLSVTLGGEIAKLQATKWEMKELRAVRVAVARFAPILGEERKKSTLADKAQGVTTIGRVTDAFDDSSTGPKLAAGVMGEYFGKNKSVGLFNTTTDLVDDRYVAEGKDAPDNNTTIEANAIHEMAHGLVQPSELANWISKLDFWTDRVTPSGKKGAEEPPTEYGKSGGAAEDLCESVAIFFVNRPMLKKVAPEREAFIAKVVAGWTPVKKQEVLEGATSAKGTGE